MGIREELLAKNYEPMPFRAKAMIPNKLAGKWKGADIYSFQEKLKLYRNLLKSTELIDFECAFNVDDKGIVSCTGHYGDNRSPKAAMCCCTGCAGSGGYHHNEILCLPGELKYYRNRWDDLLGFWRPEKGCILDRERRSITCLFYNCIYRQGKVGSEKSSIIDGLRDLAWKLREELNHLIKELT